MLHGEVVCLGTVNVDVQVRATRWPAPGQTMRGRELRMVGGGKAANVAYAARRLDVGSRLVGRVGDDAFADRALGSLVAAGVDLRATRRLPGHATGVALIVVGADGDKSMILVANANDAWGADDVNEAADAVASAPPGSVLVTDLDVAQPVVREAITAARHHGHAVIVDPAPAERLGADLYPALDYLTPNRAEVSALTGIEVRSIDDAFKAATLLVERGAGTVLVKLGADGTVVVGAGIREHLPVPPVTVVDTTGAGDAFAGALAVAHLEGRAALEAARFAAGASAVAVSRYGAQAASPTRADIDRVWP